MQHSAAFAYPTKYCFFFSQDPIPYSVQRTHDTRANNEDAVINKAIFVWSELNIKPQFWQEATVLIPDFAGAQHETLGAILQNCWTLTAVFQNAGSLASKLVQPWGLNSTESQEVPGSGPAPAAPSLCG